MFIRNLFLSTLAVAGMANAQTNKLCQAKENKIESQADLEALADCNTLEGNLYIGEDITSVDLPELTQIKGDFHIENAENLASVNLGSLRTVGGEFRLKELINLSSLNCPQLSSVGSINWVKLPELRSLTFTRKITEADSIYISDTRLESLEGIDLSTVKSFRIDNCKSLKSVSVGLKNVSEELAIEFNGKGVQIDLSQLIWAANITVRDCAAIKLPKLVHVNGTLFFEDNTFTKVELKQLKEVEASLTFVGNNNLEEIDASNLVEIGGAFKLANNTALAVVDKFGKLEQIGGAIDFSGVFTKVELESLQDVFGGFHLQTKEELDCSAFEAMEGDIIQGDDFTCETKVSNPESKDGSTSTGDDDTEGEDGDDSAAGRMAVGSILGLSMAAIFVAAF